MSRHCHNEISRCLPVPSVHPPPILPSLAPTNASLNYGGDAVGLIWGYLLGADTPPSEVDSAQAVQWLAEKRGPQQHTFLWLHFNLSHAQAVRWMERHADLPEAFFDALKDRSVSTRIERDDDTLIAVLNDANFDFAFEPSDIATLWTSVAPHLMVTGRTRPLRSVDALRTAVRSGNAPPDSSVALLAELMRTQASGLVDIVRGVTQRIDDVEDALLAARLDHKRVRLGVLRRLLVRLQRLLAPEPAALFRLLQHPPAWMSASDAQELRDSTEEFSVVLRDMQGLQERIKLLQEEIAANVQEANSRSLFVLTVVTVLALPINILAGLFGMNVGGVPLADNGNGFWIIVAVVAAFTAIAGWFTLRSPRDR